MAKDWIKQSVVYQIYPLSFKDSNGDGIGDIQGIKEKLPYLKDLGVDVIWLSPVYQSPMDDNGYDISDYYEVNPIFGTKEDLMALIEKTHQDGMKLIMDLVVNHTSDEHVWFKEALKSLDNPYRNYYIWNNEVNDIQSVFGGPAWTKDEQSGQYYFHLFSNRQPDLNWQNEHLRKEIYQMMNHWLDLGIDGFRLDVIDLIGKDVSKKQLSDGPFLEAYLREMNEACFKDRDILTVGEMPGLSIERGADITSDEKKLLSMVFQFDHIMLDEVSGKGKWALKPLDLFDLKQTFLRQQKAYEDKGWGSLYWANHDQPRAVSRFGSEPYRKESAKMLHTLLYLQRGTPYIYQGEEIGMTGIKFQIDEYKDIETINYYREALSKGIPPNEIMNSLHKKSRDNSRTPIQWDQTIHAGFSTHEPWIKVNPNYQSINVKMDLQDDDGIYHYLQRLLEIRKTYRVFIDGTFELLDKDNQSVFTYIRKNDTDEVVVICNFTQKIINYNLAQYQAYEMLIENRKRINKNMLPPYYAVVYRRRK